jgi:toxin secretion/phage lysis holin
MEAMAMQVKGWLFLVGAAVMAFLAPLAPALTFLIILMAIDLVSGLIANGKRKRLDPAVGWGGWRRKSQTILIVLSVAILQHAVNGELVQTIPAAQAVAGGFAVFEALSIVRNAILSGVRLPKMVADALAQLEGATFEKPATASK